MVVNHMIIKSFLISQFARLQNFQIIILHILPSQLSNNFQKYNIKNVDK